MSRVADHARAVTVGARIGDQPGHAFSIAVRTIDLIDFFAIIGVVPRLTPEADLPLISMKNAID
jgi:hypothetical protein